MKAGCTQSAPIANIYKRLDGRYCGIRTASSCMLLPQSKLEGDDESKFMNRKAKYVKLFKSAKQAMVGKSIKHAKILIFSGHEKHDDIPVISKFHWLSLRFAGVH